MQTRQLQQLLLTHYLFAIEMVKEAEEVYDALDLCEELGVNNGICHCARFFFKCVIADETWVEKYCGRGPYRLYWHGLPSDATTKREILSCLQARVDILNKILNNG